MVTVLLLGLVTVILIVIVIVTVILILRVRVRVGGHRRREVQGRAPRRVGARAAGLGSALPQTHRNISTTVNTENKRLL